MFTFLNQICKFICKLIATCLITCRELGIGIVAYSPLGRGFFGGKAVLESLPAESILVCSCMQMDNICNL